MKGKKQNGNHNAEPQAQKPLEVLSVKSHLTPAVQSQSTFHTYSQSSLASGFPITLTSFLTSGSFNLGPDINIPHYRNWQKHGILKRQVFPTSAYTTSLLFANEKITHTTSVPPYSLRTKRSPTPHLSYATQIRPPELQSDQPKLTSDRHQ